MDVQQASREDWYVRDRVAGQPRQIWRFTVDSATRIGVTNPENGPGCYFKADAGEDIWRCIDRQTGWLKPDVTEGLFHKMDLAPAEFYPRIARPNALGNQFTLWNPGLESEKSFVATSRGQLMLLLRKLELICQTVQPSNKTLNVYGHEIRNVLILAATEAEMHWRGILKANGVRVAKPNSNDYVKLDDPLKLRDYIVLFRDFPDIPDIKPFEGWDRRSPTDSLEWFAAYHGTKHNREEEFERGTLLQAFSAVAACVVLLEAQFGQRALGSILEDYVIVRPPSWSIEEMYMPQVTDTEWTAVFHPNLSN